MVKKKKIREVSVSLDYEVEAIRKARVTEDKKWEYYIKWSGYPEADNSWEPKSHLDGCLQLLNNFWVLAGSRQRSQVALLPFGFEVIPSHSHIEEDTNTPVTTNATSIVANSSLEHNAIPTTTIIQDLLPAADQSIDQVSDDDMPLGTINYSDPDDIPLSELQILHAPHVLKTNEDQGLFSELKNSAPPHADQNERKEDGLFSEPEDNAPLPPQSSKLADSMSHSNTYIPAHRKRKLQPRVKPIDLIEEFQAIPTKARIARRGSGPTATSAAKPNSTMQSPVSPSASTPVSADQWLKDNFQQSAYSASPTIQTPTSAFPTFNKRWKWSGQLCVGDNESEDGFADLIGNVKMSDPLSAETRPTDFSMSFLLPSRVDILCFRHLYILATLPTVLGGFRIAYFTRMTADLTTTSSDAGDDRMEEDNFFSSLVKFMERNHLYSCMPLMAQAAEVATMFILPASMQALWDTLKLPEKFRQVDATPSLLVFIGFRIHQPSKVELRRFMKVETENFSRFASSYLFSFQDLGRAVMKLEFAEKLLKRLSRRKYAIFTGSVSFDAARAQNLLDPEQDPYTNALKLIMNKSGAERLPLHEGEARTVFIHVGAWGSLHKLLGLVDRRLRRLDVEFFTYGADPTVERRFWGVQEVFPTGGIVTFTSRSIFEDPDGVVRLIGLLHEHCLWACYIHPAVITVLFQILKGTAQVEIDINKISIAHKCLECIIRAIEKEQLEVMWHPPAPHRWCEQPSSSESSDSSSNHSLSKALWYNEQENLSKSRGIELIAECERRFPAKNYTEKDIEKVLVNDMVIMQSEFRQEYRRFVIITDTGTTSNTSKDAANVSASSYEVKDMFEFTHVKKFKFDEENSRSNVRSE